MNARRVVPLLTVVVFGASCGRAVSLTDSGGADGHILPALDGHVLPAPDGHVPSPGGAVTIVTDKLSYASYTPVKATLTNGTTGSVFLHGCGIYFWEKLVNGSWVNKGGEIVCDWEGEAREVPAGTSVDEGMSGKPAGTWRVAAEYGTGCTPKQPLSTASCTSMNRVVSSPITFKADAKVCIDLNSQYAKALANAKLCPAASATCAKKVESGLICGCPTYVSNSWALDAITDVWQEAGCAAMPGVPVCDAACKPVTGASCVLGTCVDF